MYMPDPEITCKVKKFPKLAFICKFISNNTLITSVRKLSICLESVTQINMNTKL